MLHNKISKDKHDIVASIKPKLKEDLLHKLDEKSEFTRLSVPAGREKSEALAKMKIFIEKHLDEFVKLCSDVLPVFSEKDSESISTEHPTENAKRFLGLFCYLEELGFAGPKDFNKPVNFWSGQDAMKKAFVKSDELSDSEVPSVSAMFSVCQAIQFVQQQYDDYITLLTSSVSRYFASFAKDVASIYLSSDKISESPGLTAPNNFWLAELPVLMTLHKRGIVKDIRFQSYDHHAKVWSSHAVSLFSKEGGNILLRRRAMHPLDAKESAGTFKPLARSIEARHAWVHSKPRPGISYAIMQKVALEWKARTLRNKEVRKEEELTLDHRLSLA